MYAVAGRRDAEGESDGVGDGAGRVMCAERNVVGVADGGDLLHAGNAAGMRGIRLKVVACAKFDGVHDLLRREEPLAAGDGDADAAPHVRKRPHRIGYDRLFNPIGRELFERVADPERGRNVESSVALD